MKNLAMAVLLFCCAVPALAQDWTKQDMKDAFNGFNFVQYTLTGKFLAPPQHGSLAAPQLVLQCLPGEKKHTKGWYVAGQLIKGWINVGASVNSTINGVPVVYRRDDGKPQAEMWSQSTDLQGIFPTPFGLNHILFGHDLIHKVNSTPPVKKLVFMADEYMGTGVVMEFDLTNLDGPDGIASECGLAIYPKN